MNKTYEGEKDVEVRVRLSTLHALRLIAEGKREEETAKIMGRRQPNLSATLKTFREKFPMLSEIVDAVRNERLLEKKVEEPRRKFLQTLIERAEKGSYVGGPPFGYGLKDGVLFEKERQIEIVKGVLQRGLEGVPRSYIAKEFGISPFLVQRIQTNSAYKDNVFSVKRKIYRGSWNPLITPEQYEKIQLNYPKEKAPVIPRGFKWINRKKVAVPSMKQLIEDIVNMRLERKSFNEIGKALNVDPRRAQKLFRDERFTGFIETEGKLVDSGFEPLVDRKLWEKAQEIDVSRKAIQGMKEKRKEALGKLMSLMPAYRWELEDKMRIDKTTVVSYVKTLKDKGMLKEREDKLLQKSWKPFPAKDAKTRFRHSSNIREKILEILGKEGEARVMVLAQKTGCPWRQIDWHIKKMIGEGILEEGAKGFGKKLDQTN